MKTSLVTWKNCWESQQLNDIQAGVTRQVIAQGYDSLTDKQKKVFDYIVNTMLNMTCSRCGTPIPLSEISEALTNGGLCGYCVHIKEKMDKE